jgi:hypothetical protein
VGVTSVVDERGAFYVQEGAIRVVVESSAPWTGACAAEENDGSATGVRVAEGRLERRLRGTTEWAPFPPAGGDASSACFPVAEIGTAVYVYDVRLRVEWADAPGTFRSRVAFWVVP